MEIKHLHLYKIQTTALDPRTKLLILLFIAVLTMAGDITGIKIYFRLILGLIPAVLLAIDSDLKKSVGYTGLFLGGWLIESFLLLRFAGGVSMVLLIISGLITRFVPSLVMGYYFIKTTQVAHLITALHKWHVPDVLTIPVVVIFRFIPTIKEETSSITNAMRIRNINGKMTLQHPIKYIEYRLVPLMSSIVQIGNDLTAAALTRGLGGKSQRTSIYDVKLRNLDLTVLVVTMMVVLCYIFL
ncbi:energy-coupling factor transporter transmembrane component T [Enterococcus sp. DIV1420a]|uniref:energy-coupling factor transporter transmembrane component T n=1 Tax=Enterococcus sp. DIV1420a TaxID=2774672 RepID=UPI003F241B47